MGFADFWRSLTRGTRFQVLFYGGAGVIGVLCFLGPAVFTVEKLQPVLVGLGIAFLSSSVLGFAHRLFFYDDFRSEMAGLVEQSLGSHLSKHMFPFIDEGFERLYPDRRSAIRRSYRFPGLVLSFLAMAL